MLSCTKIRRVLTVKPYHVCITGSSIVSYIRGPHSESVSKDLQFNVFLNTRLHSEMFHRKQVDVEI